MEDDPENWATIPSYYTEAYRAWLSARLGKPQQDVLKERSDVGAVQRYGMVNKAGAQVDYPEPSYIGPFCLYKDHAAALARVEAKLKKQGEIAEAYHAVSMQMVDRAEKAERALHALETSSKAARIRELETILTNDYDWIEGEF